MAKARRISIKLLYNSKNISTDIAPYLKSFSFSDSVSNEADDIQITLEDRAEIWESSWFPTKGDTLKASMLITNWFSEGTGEIPIGTFEIDEIEFSGLPHEVKIKAVSVPSNNDLRGVQRNNAYEKIKLSTLAKQIADRAGLRLYLNLHEDKEIDRVEQREESDLEFLIKVAKKQGYGVRLSDEQLDVYYLQDLDVAEAVATIKKATSRITGYSFKTKTRDVYKGCCVRYENPKKGKKIEYTFNDPKKSKGKILDIHKKVNSQEEAEKLAKAELREKNKDEVTGKLDFAGLPDFANTDSNGLNRNLFFAGFTFNLEGFHVFDGKYLVEKSHHEISGDNYNCSVDVRKTLEGY